MSSFEIDGENYVQAFFRDISDQMDSQLELKESRECYYMLFNKASDGIFIFREGEFIDCNEKACFLLNVEKEFFKTNELFSLTAGYDEISDEKKELIYKLIYKGVPLAFEWKFKINDDHYIDVELRSNRFVANNKKYVQLFVKDITDKKKVTDALSKNERRLSTLMSNLPGMAYRCVRKEHLIFDFISNGSRELTGYYPKDLIGKNKFSLSDFLVCKDETADNITEIENAINEKRNFQISYRFRCADGTVKWFWEQGEPIFDENGVFISLEGFISDVTKQKEHEHELVESQKKYFKLFSDAFDAIFIIHNDIFIDCNSSALNLLDCQRYEIIGCKYNTVLTESGEYSIKKFKEKIVSLQNFNTQNFIWKFIRKNGKLFDVEISLSSFDVDGVSYIQMIAKDITERIISEKKLIESERNYRRLIESSPAGIIITDMRSIYYANPSSLKILGYQNESELHKIEVRKLVKEQYIPKIVEELKKLPKGYEMPFMEVIMIKTDNSEIEVEIKAALFKYRNKQSYQIVLRDISLQKKLMRETMRAQMIEESNSMLQEEIKERLKAEDIIKRSLKEKEVLLKEVHHRVKNNMQIISSILNLQSSYLPNDELRLMFQESQDRIKTMALIHENLYRNDNLSLINFKHYISELISNLYRSYSSNLTNIKLNLQLEEIFFTLDTGIPCGLIINELVSNSLKYAFKNVDEGRIFVHLSIDKDEMVTMVVGDDGKGISEDINYKETQSLGLQLVNTLVEQLEGTIELDNTKGTKFIITFKK